MVGDKLLRHARLFEPRLELNPVPPVESYLLDFVAGEEIAQMVGDELVADRAPGCGLKKPLSMPEVPRRAVGHRLLGQPLGRQPERWPHMPLAVDLAYEHECREVVDFGEIEATIQRHAVERSHRIAACRPYRRRYERIFDDDALIEHEVAIAGLARWHALGIFRLR